MIDITRSNREADGILRERFMKFVFGRTVAYVNHNHFN